MHHFSDALYAHVLIAAARARSARVKSKDALAIIVYLELAEIPTECLRHPGGPQTIPKPAKMENV